MIDQYLIKALLSFKQAKASAAINIIGVNRIAGSLQPIAAPDNRIASN